MKSFWFQIFGLFILIALATFFAFNPWYVRPLAGIFRQSPLPSSEEQTPSREIIKILAPDGATKAQLNLELADTPEKRTKGLGYRDSLATDSGMLFIHDKPQKYTYWMKGMRFPIDFIWIMDDTVADIITNALPPIEGQTDDTLERYAPTVDVNKVLETNSGFVDSFHIQKGDKIKIERIR